MQIGLGTAAIGRPQYINVRIGQNSKTVDLADFRKHGIRALEVAYKAGIRYFDTAPGYGMAEQIISEWLNKNDRKDIEVATKWGYKYTANFDPNAKIHEIKDHSIDLLNEQWTHSIEIIPNLTTLQIHSATFESGVLNNEEVLHRLFEIKEKHGVHIGMTSTGENQIDVLKHALDVHINGHQLFDVFQVTYNVLDQSLAGVIQDFQGKRVVVKEAMANGRLFRNEKYQHHTSVYNSLERIAQKYQVGIDAVAIRFCIDSINPFAVLSGASYQQQILENLKADTFQLTGEELEELRSIAVSPTVYWNERKLLVWN